jgi:hypothetical protein
MVMAVAVTTMTIVRYLCDDVSMVTGFSLPPLSSSSSSSSFSSYWRSPTPSSSSSSLSALSSKTQASSSNHRIEPFVNSRGTTQVISNAGDFSSESHDETSSCLPDPRIIPYDETLDLHDGPLPPGAYITDGKPNFQAKPTCRISHNVQLSTTSDNNKSWKGVVDMNEMVRRLQSCADAGFQTFQLHRQDRYSFELIRQWRKNTPRFFVQSHWSLRMAVPTTFDATAVHQQQLQTRQSIMRLIQQSHAEDDALDTLQLVYNPHSPYLLDTLDHLQELQRQGYIRSIGIDVDGGRMKSRHHHRMLSEVHAAGFDPLIDFYKQAGNLLLPPTKHDQNNDRSYHCWMNDALAGSLLTDVRNDKYGTRPKNVRQYKEERILREWASRRRTVNDQGHQNHDSTTTTPPPFSTRELQQLYHDDVMDILQWIALKHRVSVTAVALRWALESGSHDDASWGSSKQVDTTIHPSRQQGLPLSPVISTAMVDFVLDYSEEEDEWNSSSSSSSSSPSSSPSHLLSWRKAFRFQLDGEDKELLLGCSAPSLDEMKRRQQQMWSDPSHGNPEDALNDWERELLHYEREMNEKEEYSSPTTTNYEEEYPEIDFHNPKLWL